MLRALLAAALIAAPLFFAVQAHADSDDNAFLNAMSAHGITNKAGDAEMIAFAHNVCDLLGGGYSVSGLAQHLALHARNGMTDDDVAFLVKTSAAAYCPQYLSGGGRDE